MSRTRHATEEDFAEIAIMTREFFDEFKWGGIPFVSADFYMELAFQQGLLLVYEKAGKLQGFAAGFCAPCMADQLVLQCSEAAWFVRPEYRNGVAGLSLFKAMKKEAEEAGCQVLNMVALDDQVGKFYERLGMNKAEVTYTMRL